MRADNAEDFCGVLANNLSSPYTWTLSSKKRPGHTTTGPGADHTDGTGAFAYVEASGNNPEKGPFVLESRPFVFRDVGDHAINFWYHM